MVRAYVASRKPEIRVETGRGPPRVFIPQSYRPSQDAEVDFGDVYIDLARVRTLCYRFVFRLSFSGKAVHRVSPPRGPRHREPPHPGSYRAPTAGDLA